MINSQISYFLAGKTNGRLGTTFKILYFIVKKEKWPLGYSFKILHCAVKKQMAIWVQLWNFVFRCKNTGGCLGTRITQKGTSFKGATKLVTSFYNSFLKPVVYGRKNRCKKVSPQFFSVIYVGVFFTLSQNVILRIINLRSSVGIL